MTVLNNFNSRLHRIWNNMKQRCSNPNNDGYKYYGMRGVTVCKEWQEFKPFYIWAMNNGYEDNLTIDRIDVNGNYEPSNCRWANKYTQANNTRQNRYIMFKNTTHTLKEWSVLLNIPYGCLQQRLIRGWSIEKALTTPPRIIQK